VSLAAALREEVTKTPLAARFERHAAAFLERHGAAPPVGSTVARGLARLLAASSEAAGFLARRGSLLERVRTLDAGFLERRARELDALARTAPGPDLEAFLDELRLLRREETLLAAVLDLADAVPFEAVSAFLSVLAEGLVARALRMAESRSGPGPCVVAMGKLAGREFTYHSDLDLVFLHPGGAGGLPDASRVAQRLVSQLSTMTGAGVAYAVDARLRPSGQQGALVTTFDGFEDYQLRHAQTWEHLALLRSRVIAGDPSGGEKRLGRLRDAVLARGAEPWGYVADLRARVHAERAREGPRPREGPERIAFKTGPGGIMDVEFLACAGLLERGPAGARSPDASIPSLLRAAAGGPGVEAILVAYRWLRRLEARARLVAGRAVEHIGSEPEAHAVLAELVEAGSVADTFQERMASVRREVRLAFERVSEAGTIRALGG
jgi:glutamate-ammonia-ligase adenylyltransferase